MIHRKLEKKRPSPVGKGEAARIARRAVINKQVVFPPLRQFTVYDSPPVNLYRPPSEPCWYVRAPWNDGFDGLMIRSSRLIVVSKRTGRVLYDGSAFDEG